MDDGGDEDAEDAGDAGVDGMEMGSCVISSVTSEECFFFQIYQLSGRNANLYWSYVMFSLATSIPTREWLGCPPSAAAG